MLAAVRLRALQAALADPRKAAVLMDMYRQWPWWRELVDLIEMVMAKGTLDRARSGYGALRCPPSNCQL